MQVDLYNGRKMVVVTANAVSFCCRRLSTDFDGCVYI